MKGISAEIQKRLIKLADKVRAILSEIYIETFKSPSEKEKIIAEKSKDATKQVLLILINCEDYDGIHPTKN